ncbi:uncharacterized protein Dwil_GK25620 [Drosophila willistoni]|uniref:Suppressor of cytokine signaling 7 n=1 Tax=Drosophila willistoni TaxID=7260 RepID=B4NEB9_DROWI|nr:uncharacterized protein Dwil_GK25620 [Drosophila willistoni]
MDSSSGGIKLKDTTIIIPNNNTNSNNNNAASVGVVGGGVGGIGVGIGGGGGGGGGISSSICSSDSFSIMPPPHGGHELVSANSIELNAAASLSDDSGVPLTTNSSISSGDSYRIGMCKFEIEMVESDGEVSQFDSLDNCSEGGMSAENFNTLKKGPLAPIDPPPEFQDSPQTTLVRSISKNIVNSLRRWTSSQSSFEHLKDDNTITLTTTTALPATTTTTTATGAPVGVGMGMGVAAAVSIDSNALDMQTLSGLTGLGGLTLKESYATNKHLYSSDSILNSHTDNIYDEPNNIISSSLGNSVDLMDELDEDDEEQCRAASSDQSQSSCSPLPSPPPPVSLIKIKQTLCPYYQDHTRYFKAIPTEQDTIASAKAAAAVAQQRFNVAGLSEIHDYDLYYGARRQMTTTTTTTTDNNSSSLQRRQMLYSPLGHTSHCHYHHPPPPHHNHHHHPHHHYHHPHHHHHHHHGNHHAYQRPNSRNSLNSRLSSSHNSLNVSSSNKPDDSIFITQAMSHDALFTREISDFYNVPIDSDIYAFPVDMIEQPVATATSTANTTTSSSNPTYHKSGRRNKRNKRKQQRYNATDTTTTNTTTMTSTSDEGKHGKYRLPIVETEPLHMTLDEVKQLYHTLYSDAGHKSGSSSAPSMHGGGGGGGAGAASGKVTKSSNETIWSVSTNATSVTTTRMRNSNNRLAGTPGSGSGSAGGSEGKYLSKQSKHNLDNDKLNNNNNSIHLPNNKHVLHTEKKSQFTLNLKQKFCSIFRFRRNNHRYRAAAAAAAATAAAAAATTAAASAAAAAAASAGSTTTTTSSSAATTGTILQASSTASNNGGNVGVAGQLQQTSSSSSAGGNGGGINSSNSILDATEEATHNCLNRGVNGGELNADLRKKFQSRALPPLPKKAAAYAIDAISTESEQDQLKKNTNSSANTSGNMPASSSLQEPRALQFTSSIEKVKDYGWYWGPLSSEAAEKVLSNEPDGSFIVRDSSDDHYIFSLSFKLNNCVRHVRIEQDQGTFSFGSYAKFKSQTITEFIEKAVEHSRSGRYLFFLHRRPEHGPMRVQLTNPVSRFKHVQSLQHMCRFVILKAVIRKDLIQTLPLPRRLLDYLNYKHCYSEQVESDSSHSQISGDGSM